MDPKATEGHIVPSVDDLTDEAFIILSAAQDTTGNVMTVALYETILNDEIYTRVVEELKQAFPDPNVKLDFLTLEKLPYLVSFSNCGDRRTLTEVDGCYQRIPEVGPHSICPISASANININRLSYGVIGRIPRVTPAGGAEFNGISIPAGVSLRSIMSFIH